VDRPSAQISVRKSLLSSEDVAIIVRTHCLVALPIRASRFRLPARRDPTNVGGPAAQPWVFGKAREQAG